MFCRVLCFLFNLLFHFYSPEEQRICDGCVEEEFDEARDRSRYGHSSATMGAQAERVRPKIGE